MNASLTVQTATTDAAGNTKVTQTDYANCTTEAEWVTNRFDSPGKLTFTCIETGPVQIANGSKVTFQADGDTFVGYVFVTERKAGGETDYTAYDQIRYLKANASYVFQNMTVGQIIQQIAADFDLTCGDIADTGYAFPSLIKENESCLDIIYDALAETIYRTGKIFNFFDDAGKLVLREAVNMLTTTLVGENSGMTDFSYKGDIDSDTYNRIKLVRANTETGKGDLYMHEDTTTQQQWGLLQYYDEVDENLNDAQIDELCQTYLSYYNRELKTVTVDAIGLPGIRAGSIVPIKIGEVQDLSVSRLLIAEKVTHTYEGDLHTMSIEVKSFEQLGGASIYG